MTDTPHSTASRTLSDNETPFEHLAIRDVNSVQESVDPRLSLSSRPSARQLEEGFPSHVGTLRGEHAHGEDEKGNLKEEKEGVLVSSSDEILYVDWEKGDPRNPANYSRGRKWAITLTSSALTGMVAAVASTYAMGYPSMTRDLNCTNFQATLGLSLYALGFAVFPLILAPLSEEFGRQPLYIGSTILLIAMHIGVALAKNIQSVIIFRLLAGAAGSTGSTMVGGTIADIWAPHERGIPMAVFSIAAMGCTGLGPVFAGWVEMNTRLEWRWIQWIHLIVTGVFFVIMLFTMKETRSSVLLVRLVRKLRKETGDNRYRARIEDERGSLRTLMLISCTRPVHLLLTEPVVASFSLWIGFAWGVLYSMIESISPAFRELHHFNVGEVGTVFVTMFIGSLLGYLSNTFIQEKLYNKNFKAKGHEARLYSSCIAGILFPVSMFIYAWTSFEHVNWVGMAIGIVLFMWSMYIIYLAVFTYLADCYGPFASSALAGQSLCRNLAGMAFPLFSTQMYDRLTFKWASTIFACIAVLMMPIPFILFRWGPQIRARSKFAKEVPSFGS
ncbi:MFS general substrate transporter [Phellopilus nigrolimitatus]|nr:MFS general substrate transporter [Phellopilus nigrolimitatus]